ncbi:MAG: FAD-dependent oxidoreductase [Gammaproteobacteria bacterium]
MKTHARVVVIGGGIGGCSTLYHLTKEGWNDVVLVERDELTSGTTWHSAAQCPNLAFNQLLILLRSYTIGLYRELAQDPDYPINYHHAVGGLRLITDQNNLDACHHIISVAKSVGVEFELLSPEQTAARNPLLKTDDLLAALWDPLDGDIDPAQLCQALARRSRHAGAEIYRHNPVIGLEQKSNAEWIVRTRNGDIHCEHIVNAAGYRVNEVGALIGVEYPVVSMEHMYFVTEPIGILADRPGRVPMVRCPRDTFYMRQEKSGLLIGVYEYDCKTFGTEGIDPGFVNALCPNDLDRCLPKLEAVFERLPCLKHAGIQSVINGPITYAADAEPMVGKLPGVRNAWSMNGLRVGIGEGGGYGKMLAQMMVHGETEWDCWQLDPRRITRFADQAYTIAKAVEDYQNEFRWHLPHEHRPAGRPLRFTPLYSTLKAMDAEFGVVNGWERVMFYKPNKSYQSQHSYRFNNWHQIVENEIKSLCNNVGLAEISGFTRYQITGAGVAEWLDTLTCSRLPDSPGDVRLCYFLTDSGNLLSEATLAMLDRDHFWFGSAAAAERHDMDWLTERLPSSGDISIANLTDTITTLVIAGPKLRQLMSAVSPRSEWSGNGFPGKKVRRCRLGEHIAVVMSVSYSGESACEIHISNSELLPAYRLIVETGKDLGLVHFGMHAIESMRIEKGFGHWKADLISEFNPFEAELGHFVDMEKSFPGKVGLQRQLDRGYRKKLMLIEVHSDLAPAQPGESVFSQDRVIGVITSASWGYRYGKNVAMCYLEPEFCENDTKLKVLLLGQWVEANVIPPL